MGDDISNVMDKINKSNVQAAPNNKQLEEVQKALIEKNEECAKYKALAEDKAGGVEQVEEMENKLLEERETVAKLRQELMRAENAQATGNEA